MPVRRSTKREIQEARRRAREKDTRLLAHKQCSECGKSKPILEFPVSGYHKHHPEIPIYRHYCLECQRGKLSQKVFEANAAKLNVLIAAVALDDFLTKHPLPIAYPALDALREHVAVMKRYYRPRPYFREVSPKGDVIIKPKVGRERIVGHGDLP